MREWGRRGSPGTMRLDHYPHRPDAEAAERRGVKRRLRHGYASAQG
jgi:predicted DNA-binding WGR domain protein